MGGSSIGDSDWAVGVCFELFAVVSIEIFYTLKRLNTEKKNISNKNIFLAIEKKMEERKNHKIKHITHTHTASKTIMAFDFENVSLVRCPSVF